MGLHPKATFTTPTYHDDFPLVRRPGRGVKVFGDWWDEQTDAAAAVEAVWPTQRRER